MPTADACHHCVNRFLKWLTFPEALTHKNLRVSGTLNQGAAAHGLRAPDAALRQR